MIRNTQVQLVEAVMPKTRTVVYGNLTLQVYSIGWLANYLQLARVTLRKWEQKGILPSPIFEVNGYHRLYSAMEIEKYSTLVRKHYQGTRDLRLLQRSLHSAQVEIRKHYANLKDGKKQFIRLTNFDVIEKSIAMGKEFSPKKEPRLKLRSVVKNEN